MPFDSNGNYYEDNSYNPLPVQDWTQGDADTYSFDEPSDSYISDPWGAGDYYSGQLPTTKASAGSGSSSSGLGRISGGGSSDYGHSSTGARQTYKAATNTIPNVKSASGNTAYDQIPNYVSPTLISPTTFTMPLRDAHKLASYTQEAAAPGYAKLNRNANAIAARVNDRYAPGGKMKLRDALAGVGEGYGSITEAAGKTATNRYEQEYNDQYKTDVMNWQAQNQNIQAQNTENQKAAQLAYQAELDRIWKLAMAGRTA